MSQLAAASVGSERRPTRRTEPVFWLFALATGLISAFFLLGSTLDPTNIRWLQSDSAQNYMGWAFLRDDPQWTFPLTWTYRIGYPGGVSVGFLDSIPLLATAFRPFSAVLPHPFQYLGLFGAASLVLQAYFGAKLAWRVCGDRLLPGLLGGVFFALAPALMFRVVPHLSLTSHWLIVAALWRYATPQRQAGVLSWFWPLPAIGAIAAAIHPYIAALCQLVVLAACLRLWLESRAALIEAVGLAILSALAALLVFWLAGFLPFENWRFFSAEPFGSYSMNLLSPIDPHEWKSLVLPPQSWAGPAQIDGYNYLGLGVLLLLAVTFFGLAVGRISPCWSAVTPLLLVGCISFLLALGQTITVGSHTIAAMPIPDFLRSALSPFRASGRLFWVAYYLLFMLALAGASRVAAQRWQGILIAACLAIQLADTAPLLAWVRMAKHDVHPEQLTGADWTGIGATHRHLEVLPPWQCDPHRTPGGVDGYWAFAEVALREKMTTNSYYASRIGDGEKRLHCDATVARIRAEGLADADAYVLDDQLMRLAALPGLPRHYCRAVDGFSLCTVTAHQPGIDPDLLARLFAPYRIGTALGVDEAMLAAFGAGGWRGVDGTGVWSLGPEAALAFALDAPPDSGLRVTLDLQALTMPGHPRRRVEVAVNGRPLAEIAFELGKDPGIQRIDIPRDVAAAGRRLLVSFRVLDPFPTELSGELSRLGVRLSGVTLERQQ